MSYQVNSFILPKVSGTKFSVPYAINSYHLVTITNVLLDSNFMNQFNYLFISPSQFISSLKVYPIDFNKFFRMTEGGESAISMRDIKIADKTITKDVYTAQGYPCHNLEFNNQVVKYNALTKIGTIRLTRKFDNFLDFNPYTQIVVYLPFYNEVELNPVDLYDEDVDVYYFPDFVSGRATIFIQNSKRVIFTATFQLGFDIPFGATNSVDILRNQINQVTNLFNSATREGGVSPSNLITTGVNSILNMQLGYSGKSASVGCENFHNSTNIQVIRKTPKVVNIANYNHYYGKPLMQNYLLSSMHGYTEIEEIHLEGFNETLDVELSEIESLLKQGVILP